MPDPNRRAWLAVCIATGVLALPALGVHGWMAWTFPSYLHGSFGQDVVFAFAWCGLLACVVRGRVLWLASLPIAVLAYATWLFLVLGEGVSYYLQADTFNARFFAHLNPDNLHTGLRAFPAMIGGGIAVFVVMLIACAAFLAWVRPRTRRAEGYAGHGPMVVTLVVLVLAAVGLASSPRRLIAYLMRIQQSAHFADTPAGQAVADLLDLHPVSKKALVAAPGKNLVLIYLESLERIYWDPRVFPGLTPNLDRLRLQGLDFSGFQTFSGATYTMAGIFASQCGVPLFTSAFAGIDELAGNTTGAATFQPKIACLGDVLHRAGYTQIYMGGAPIQFSNKGLFFRLHGYDQALGLLQLEAGHQGKLPESGWGLYDSALFKLALQRYEQLEASRKPFNLSMLTLDTHPPNGRPSPGCPRYPRSPNSMLQAVHCTDYLLGKFIDALSKQPAWKNTVVLIMSDHLMMRNVAEPLFPADYHRQPALLVLNAGRGVRPATMYHMDIAPTLLDLLGVRTNATFIAGQDRSGPDAEGSALVDNRVTDAVLRKALWSRENEFALCKRNTLIGWTADGNFDVGGRELGMSLRGERAVGTWNGQTLDFFIDNANAKLVIAGAAQQADALRARGDASVLTISRLAPGTDSLDLFSVDWLGHGGAWAHIADIPRLDGLTITSPKCGTLIRNADKAPAGARLDLSRDFKAVTAVPPELSPGTRIDFTQPAAEAYEAGLGWLAPATYGSWTLGPESRFGFRLPGTLCRAGAVLRMRVDPYLPPSRPRLDAEVRVNGRLATTWRFDAHGAFSTNTTGASDNHEVLDVTAPIDPGDACTAHLDVRFSRPGADPPPYPKAEDSRPLQLRVLGMQVDPAKARD